VFCAFSDSVPAPEAWPADICKPADPEITPETVSAFPLVAPSMVFDVLLFEIFPVIDVPVAVATTPTTPAPLPLIVMGTEIVALAPLRLSRAALAEVWLPTRVNVAPLPPEIPALTFKVRFVVWESKIFRFSPASMEMAPVSVAAVVLLTVSVYPVVEN
jgi:hypothetical protein